MKPDMRAAIVRLKMAQRRQAHPAIVRRLEIIVERLAARDNYFGPGGKVDRTIGVLADIERRLTEAVNAKAEVPRLRVVGPTGTADVPEVPGKGDKV